MERILLAQVDSPDITGGGSFGSDGGSGAAVAGENIWQFNQYIFGQEGEGGLKLLFSGIRAAFTQRRFATPGGFLTALLPVLLTFGGLIFFVMLIIGSFQILMGGANPKSVEGGKKRITYALVGLLLLFATFWIGEIISAIFGLDIGLSTTTP